MENLSAGRAKHFSEQVQQTIISPSGWILFISLIF